MVTMLLYATGLVAALSVTFLAQIENGDAIVMARFWTALVSIVTFAPWASSEQVYILKAPPWDERRWDNTFYVEIPNVLNWHHPVNPSGGNRRDRYSVCNLDISARPNNWLRSDVIPVGDSGIERLDVTIKYKSRQCNPSHKFCRETFFAHVWESNSTVSLTEIPNPISKSSLYRRFAKIRRLSDSRDTMRMSLRVSSKFIVLGFRDRGGCRTLYSVRVSYKVCPEKVLEDSLVSVPRTFPQLASIPVNGYCTAHSVKSVPGSLIVLCDSNGEWNTSQLEDRCICKEGKGNIDGKCTDCPPGKFNEGDGYCRAMSKCMEAKPDCDYPRAKCTIKNAAGKERYSCHCKAGYTGKPTKCIDADECSTDGKNECPKDAECMNNPGSYECRCKNGFSGDGFTCSDIDECANKQICPQNAICNNFEGSFECLCKNGFDGKDPFKNCSDVDECQLGACGYARHTCTNTLGSFDCKCSPGFNIVDDASGEDKCEDINECETLEKPCGSYNFYECVNMDGDYTCYCENGYNFSKEKQTCEDIDECVAGDFPCVEQANCVNNQGDFECVCPEGYEGNGKDYCSANSSPSVKKARTWTVFVTMTTTSLITTLLKNNQC